ncbi:uncharacterized protein B0H18DRAFT_1115587 [Fomitopsis serialis]|uniref:uncharacterized protein n=1 Tax=Fomitopsis serialis TaxID=139415 RepID=UPI002007EA75|nr:uncharacterized protein B0H18DRAFT_1115587 [Neoantrodia serialis]KAH9932941.1 hypothetical protein B0H18DRAFT_1115587 [Neoantrodia serialis]
MTVGESHPTASSSVVATPTAVLDASITTVPPTVTTRAVSDTRKRRRVSTDVDGPSAQTDAVPRVQDPVVALTPHAAPTQHATTMAISISSSSSVEELQDPPALTTSDIEMDDVAIPDPDEMELSTAHIRRFYGLPPTYTADAYRPRPVLAAPGCLSGPGVPGTPPRVRQAPGASFMVQRYLDEQAQREDNPYVLVREDFAGGSIEALIIGDSTNPFIARQGDVSHPALYVSAVEKALPASLGIGKGKAPQRNATAGPSNTIRSDAADAQPLPPPTYVPPPRPVHYAPGPFPNFATTPITPIFPAHLTPLHFPPVPPAVPAPSVEPAFPAGPIAPLPQAHGFSAPSMMTRAPPGGWLPLQGDDFFWPYGNMEQSQLAVWTTDPNPCVLLHFLARSGNDPGNHGRVTMAQTIFHKVYDIRTATITQPIAANPQPRPNAYPTFYRVSNITIPQRNALLRDQWISTTDGTVGILAAPHEPPTFMGGWRFPGRLVIGEPSDEGIAQGFLAGFESPNLASLITTLLIADISSGGRWRHLSVDDARRLVLQSIRVRQIRLREGIDEEPIALLYVESPTADAAEWVNFRRQVREQVYGGAYAGPPELITDCFFWTDVPKATSKTEEAAAAAVEDEEAGRGVTALVDVVMDRKALEPM